MNRPRLLVWCHGVPHSSEGASRIIFWHYLDQLRDTEFDVLCLLFVEEGTGTAEDVDQLRHELASDRFRIEAFYTKPLLQRTRVSVSMSTAELQRALPVVEEFGPELCLCIDITAAWAADASVDLPTVVWLGDLNFQTVWHHAWYAAHEDPRQATRLPVAAERARRWRQIYRDVLSSADRVIVSSASAVGLLARVGVRANYLPYPWPADADRSLPRYSASTPTFLFLGTLHALGSRSALHFIFRRLHQALVERWGAGGFRIHVAGRGYLPTWAGDEISRRREFEYLGFVPDLDEVLSNVHAVIAPIDVPVGNRSRILTAMGKGRLVIAHRNVALGNPELVHERNCLLAASVREYVDAMSRAVTDAQLAMDLEEQARRDYRASFAPQHAANALIDVLRDLSATSVHS